MQRFQPDKIIKVESISGCQSWEIAQRKIFVMKEQFFIWIGTMSKNLFIIKWQFPVSDNVL